jgi:hypothetical protein
MCLQKTQLRIEEFRQQVYQTFDHRADTLFEIIDALVLETAARSPVELTLSAVFRRRWSSLYDALDGGRIKVYRLRQVLIEFAPQTGFVADYRAVAIDHSAYPRPDAKTLADRAYHHQPTRAPGGKPVAIGHGYSFAVQVPEAEGSWVVPLDVRRIASQQKPVGVAVEQLRQIVMLSDRRVLALVDSEYIRPEFIDRTTRTSDDQETARPLERTILGRLRPNRTLYRQPPPYSGFGAPRKDGPVFNLKKPETWGQPDQQIEIEDAELGTVRLSVWHNLHFKRARQHPLTLICVQVLDSGGQPRYQKPLWLVWQGEPLAELQKSWRYYLRRFAVEHFLRFLKQSLLWTKAHLGTPEREELWTWLVLIAYWHLWLARSRVQDQPRPWERSRSQSCKQLPLSPGRVRRALGGLFAAISTPACAPKLRGKSPGRQKGHCPGPRPRFSVIKKGSQPMAARL